MVALTKTHLLRYSTCIGTQEEEHNEGWRVHSKHVLRLIFSYSPDSFFEKSDLCFDTVNRIVLDPQKCDLTLYFGDYAAANTVSNRLIIFT